MRSALHPIPNNERFQQFRNRWRNLWRDLTPICPSNFFSIRYHRKLETYIFEKFVLSFVLFEGGNISKEKKCYVFSKVFIPQQSGRILLTRNTKHEPIKCEEGRRSRNEKRFFTERTKNSRRIEFLRRLGILNENSMKSKHRRMFVINICWIARLNKLTIELVPIHRDCFRTLVCARIIALRLCASFISYRFYRTTVM